MWTFGRKIAIGFAIAFVLLLGVGTVAYRAMDNLSRTSELVAHTHLVLEHIANVFGELRDAETGQRGFVITGDDAYLEPYNSALGAIPGLIKDLRSLTIDNRNQQERIDEAEPLIAAKLSELKHSIDLRRSEGIESATKLVKTNEGKQYMDALRKVLDKMEGEERDLLKQRNTDAVETADVARATIIWGTGFCLIFVCIVGYLITRSLTEQIGSAVKHIQSSSAELQAAATQQATGAKEQATAMSEITTTISELLATSRQIAESSQRVADVAGRATEAAGAGAGTVQKADDSIGGIRRQVDLVVGHMLDLGKKSQQIGSVLDIVLELAEQTNILAINATIEAAGAGESGRRFAVVADEIRKLADRVAGSTKEIRGLIEDVRSAVNTTVMTTETSSKAVDAGSRQFADVAASFQRIAELISTTTEASREIGLSTKQQATAVEQVNVAIADVAQATRETEASSGQTLQTASQLAALSKELLRLVKPQTVG